MATSKLVYNSHGQKYEVARVSVSSLDELQRADHIAFHRHSGAYWHHAIVELIDREGGEIHVIEYSNTPKEYLNDNCGSPPTIKGKVIAKVVRGKYEFQNDLQLYLLKHEQCLDPEDVIKRAIGKLGEEKYNPFTNNCEHFAMWCKTGISISDQVKKASEMAVKDTGKSVAASLAATLRTKKAAKEGEQETRQSEVRQTTEKEETVPQAESKTGEDPTEAPEVADNDASQAESNTGENSTETSEATENDASQTKSNTGEDRTETPEATDNDASQTKSNTGEDRTETPEATENDASQTKSNTGADRTETPDALDNNVYQIDSSIQFESKISEETGETLTQAVSKAGQETVKSGNREAAKAFVARTVLKGGEGVAKTGAREGSKKVLIESARKSAAAGTGDLLIPGAVSVCTASIMESMFAAYDIRCAYKDMIKGTITTEEFKTVVHQRIITGSCNVYGSTVGATIGQLLIPVPGIGAIVGSAVGGLSGSFVGNLMANRWLSQRK